jgi:O-antigen ligase
MKNSIEIIAQNPIFGVGIGNYLLAQSAFPMKYSYHFLQPVHNIILLLLSEVGFIFFGYICFVLFKWFRKNSRKEHLYLFGVVLLTGMFDHYWLTLQQNFLLIPVIFGLLHNQKKDVV